MSYIYGFQAEKRKIRKLNFKKYYEYLLTEAHKYAKLYAS